jgi:adenylate cyclase
MQQFLNARLVPTGSLAEDERRLAAIMFTDMVGYTALGQLNESLSLALVEEQRKLVRPILARHNGREVKTIGDAFLVEFESALEAVRCAYEIQRATKEFNLPLAEDRRVHLRVGVHLGDVVESQGDISGDAVNVASRIEPLAEDGGVCITRQVYDQVRGKFELTLESIGAKPLKNVKEPIEVYKVLMPWNKEVPQSSKFDKRRIAVLPLSNISPDPRDEYFADGMTEELISNLSKIQDLKVISRTSIMRYKATSKKMDEIARELQVGSILEGTVRKASDDLRISVQLIDAHSDEHLWSQDYDRRMDSVFGVQKEIALKVSDALKIRLLTDEKVDLEKRPTGDTQAYTLYLKGRYFWNERTKEGLDKAVKYFEEAINLDSKYALAYSGLADCYVILGAYGRMSPGDSFPRAKEYAMKSIEIDPRLSEPHTTLADVFNSYEGMWEESESEYKRAIELKPSYATAHMWYGLLLLFLLRFEEARSQIAQAVELDPLSRIGKLNLANTAVYEGRLGDAIHQYEAALEEDPEFAYIHNSLGWAYAVDSRFGEAIDEMKQAITKAEGDLVLRADLACMLGFSGRRDEAYGIYRELEGASGVNYVSKVKMAQLLFALGKRDQGFLRLEEALVDRSVFTQHGGYLLDMRVFPCFAQVRADPRWDIFVRRLRIPAGPI